MEKIESSKLIKKVRKVTFDLHYTEKPTKATHSSKYRFQVTAHSITQGCNQLMDSLLNKQVNRVNANLKEDLPPVQKPKSLSVSIRKAKKQTGQNQIKKKMADLRNNKNECFSNDYPVKVKYQKQQSLCVKLQRQEEDETISKIRQIYLEKENNLKKLTETLVNSILGGNNKKRGIGRNKTVNNVSTYAKVGDHSQKTQPKFYYNYDSKKEGLNNVQNWKTKDGKNNTMKRIKVKHLNKQQLRGFTTIKVIDQAPESSNQQPDNIFLSENKQKKSFVASHKQAQTKLLTSNNRVHCVPIES